MTPIDENPTKLDKLGIWVSSLCALHCLALPVLVPLLPLIGSSFFCTSVVWENDINLFVNCRCSRLG